MIQSNRGGDYNCDAYKSDSTKITHDAVTGNLALLSADTTYYIPLGSTHSPQQAETALVSIHLKWDANLAGTITFESSNFAAHRGNADTGPDDVPAWDTTAGNWVQENPSAAVVSVVGSGNSATALTITVGGSAAGAAIIHLGNLGTRRGRLKFAITHNGALRVAPWGKVG